MDTLTHALSGALLARATAAPQPAPDRLPTGARMALGFAAAAFPDSDIVLRFVDTLTYLNEHRGVTHSLLMLPLWAALLAVPVRWLDRRRRPWRAYAGVIALGIGIHIAGDVITAYGTRVLAPWSDLRAAFPTTFIIDLYFTAIIVIGLLLSMWPRAGRRAARAGVLVLVVYVGFQGILHVQAREVGRAYARATGLEGAKVQVLPQPLSPFNWKLLVIAGDEYREAKVNLWRRKVLQPAPGAGRLARIDASYLPPTALDWQRHFRFGADAETVALARDAWHHEALAPLRRFSMYPVLYELQRAAGRSCARFIDLRFTLSERVPPFRFEACRDGAVGGWSLEAVR